jgi:putative sugar O-methyltransferase
MRVENAHAERLRQLRETPEYAAYQEVRNAVLELKEHEREDAGTTVPSEYWQEELSNFEYMLDASPLIVDKLRHHTYHVTGLRVYDYRTHKDEAARRFAEKLDALVAAAGGTDLLVPESPRLGGFGFEINGALYNVDTLKFFEALIALDRGEVLQLFRDSERRRVVVEIGAGWGGFAYQFKTLFPNTTYVIVDLPELFLFSATYLTALFPEARIALWREGDLSALDREDAPDFLFVPHTAWNRPALHVDLTVNMVSFQEMTSEQVETYVRTAFEQDCRFLYSLNRDRSLYNPQLTSVRSIMDRYYSLREMPILPVGYSKMLPRPDGKQRALSRMKAKARRATPKPERRPDRGYKHVIGWKRSEPAE